jgi:hypothetical protein
VATLTALRTTCEKSCGADAPDATLTVRASGVETTYKSNFYAGCPGTVVMPPLIAFSDLVALAGQLGMLVNP